MFKALRFRSFRSRLMFWLLTFSVIPLLLICEFVYEVSVENLKEVQIQKLSAVRDLKLKTIDRWLDNSTQEITNYAGILETAGLQDIFDYPRDSTAFIKRADMIRDIFQTLAKGTDLLDIFLINPATGVVEVSSMKGLEGKNESGNTLFTEPLKTGKPFLKDIHISETLKKYTMSISLPITVFKDGKSRVTAILAARIDIENSLFPLLTEKTGMGRTGETFIINQDKLAASPLRMTEVAPLHFKMDTPSATNALAGKSGVWVTKDYRNEQALSAYTYLPLMKWGLISEIDMAEVNEPVLSFLKKLLVIFFLLLVGICAMVFFIARSIANPLSEMTEIAKRIQSGDMEARNIITTEDEIGYLARSFNGMADSLLSQVYIHNGVSRVVETLVSETGMKDFSLNVVDTLSTVTDATMCAFYTNGNEGGMFHRVASVGMNSDLPASFNADQLEGDFSWALHKNDLKLTRDIPRDTVFRYKTFLGDALPKEIITVPIMVKENVEAFICLASIKGFSDTGMEILHRTWKVINTAFTNLITNEETKRLAEELQIKNDQLNDFTQELQQRTYALKLQSEELNEQNLQLKIQRYQLDEANRLKSEFLANMSHELRTPLNSILALATVVKMQAQARLSEEEAGYLEIIERNGKQLLHLINDILDLAKVESGNMEIFLSSFSLTSLIGEITDGLDHLFTKKGVTLLLHFQEGLPTIESDEKRVRQILVNLIGNAIKFTESGSVTVSASFDGERFEIIVKDTGIGIPEKDLPHIFEEFRQIDGTLSRKYEGTGLGLALVARLLKLIGGTIQVKSNFGKGSAFTVALPSFLGFTRKDQEPLAPETKEEASQHTSIRKKILLIEDDPAVVIQLRAVLESEGYSLDVAQGGKYAVEYISFEVPDAIILDLMMPEMDGFQVLSTIRSNPATAGVPVMILTAKELTAADIARLQQEKIHYMVQKGDVDKKGLLKKVSSLLSEQKISEKERSPEKTLYAAQNRPDRSLAQKGLTIDKGTGIDQAGVDKKRKGSMSGHCPTILIIEDNPDNMTTMKAILQKNYVIQEAKTGESGLRQMLTEEPDCVLLDISLPDMDGGQVIRILRAEEAQKNRHTPVIVVTAHAMKGDREKFLMLGGDDYLSKPVDIDELHGKIDTLLRHRGTRQIEDRP